MRRNELVTCDDAVLDARGRRRLVAGDCESKRAQSEPSRRRAPTSANDRSLSPRPGACLKALRPTRRGVLLGLSGSQLVVVGLSAIMLVFALYVGGGPSLFYVVPVLLACAALAFVGIGGRKLIEWLPIVSRWAWRSTGGQLLFRRRIVKPRPAGTLSLSGDAARLRQWFDPESGAVMVHDPHTATLTAIVGFTHPAFILLDPIEQQRRVTGWGRVLATACRSGRIASVQVMERTLPTPARACRLVVPARPP